MTAAARSVYELQIVHPTTRQRRAHFSWLAEVLMAFGSDGASPTYLTMDIVDKRSGSVVRTMGELPVAATDLATEIEGDLDHLAPDAFAQKWLREVPNP